MKLMFVEIKSQLREGKIVKNSNENDNRNYVSRWQRRQNIRGAFKIYFVCYIIGLPKNARPAT